MVERLTASDLEAVIALWESCGLTRPWNDPELDFWRALNSPSSVVLGIRDAGALIATVMVGADGHRGWVYYLAVVPDRQGEGLGKRLMEAAETWLVKNGLPKIQFMVRTSNTTVLEFYEQLGYQRQDCVVLGRRLDEES